MFKEFTYFLPPPTLPVGARGRKRQDPRPPLIVSPSSSASLKSSSISGYSSQHTLWKVLSYLLFLMTQYSCTSGHRAGQCSTGILPKTTYSAWNTIFTYKTTYIYNLQFTSNNATFFYLLRRHTLPVGARGRKRQDPRPPFHMVRTLSLRSSLNWGDGRTKAPAKQDTRISVSSSSDATLTSLPSSPSPPLLSPGRILVPQRHGPNPPNSQILQISQLLTNRYLNTINTQ